MCILETKRHSDILKEPTRSCESSESTRILVQGNLMKTRTEVKSGEELLPRQPLEQHARMRQRKLEVLRARLQRTTVNAHSPRAVFFSHHYYWRSIVRNRGNDHTLPYHFPQPRIH